MILEKRYGINLENIDEVILEMAKDINNGYTFQCSQRNGEIRLSVNTHYNEPCYYIYLKKKENF